jgi:hypothetical protein
MRKSLFGGKEKVGPTEQYNMLIGLGRILFRPTAFRCARTVPAEGRREIAGSAQGNMLARIRSPTFPQAADAEKWAIGSGR